MKKSKIDLAKKEVKFAKLKTPNAEPLFDLTSEIDNFLSEFKKLPIPDEEKIKLLKGFNKLIVNISDNFKKQAEKYNIEFNEPISVAILRDKI